jgi:AraC-like DNA-binding protein
LFLSLLQRRSHLTNGGSLILPIYCLFLSLCETYWCKRRRAIMLSIKGNAAITMKARNGNITQLSDGARGLRTELARGIAFFIGSAEKRITDVPGLSFFRRTGLSAPESVTYEPSLAVVAQGRKRADLGGTSFIFDESRFLLTSLDLPVVSQVIEASEAAPYLCFFLKLEMSIVRELLSREEVHTPYASSRSPAMATGEITSELLGACCRLVELLDHPQDIPFLSGLIQREIIYRILQAPAGARLRAIATVGGQSQRTARAIAWIRANYEKPLRLEELAKITGMGVSTLHNHFRALTAMSPLQYQKQLRLQAARSRMLIDGIDAASAAFEVGYESSTQFNREYSRLFGQPPMRDIRTLRAASASALDSASIS